MQILVFARGTEYPRAGLICTCIYFNKKKTYSQSEEFNHFSIRRVQPLQIEYIIQEKTLFFSRFNRTSEEF